MNVPHIYIICLYEFCTYTANIAATVQLSYSSAHVWTNTFSYTSQVASVPITGLHAYSCRVNFCEEFYLVSCNCHDNFSISHLDLREDFRVSNLIAGQAKP